MTRRPPKPTLFPYTTLFRSYATLVSQSPADSLGRSLLGLPALHQPAKRPRLRTLRILVRDDQGGRNRGFHSARRRPPANRTHTTPIHRPWRILPARYSRPAAGHHLRDL